MQPQRFDLKYQAQGEGAQGDGYERPVMVHRAVLGSVVWFTGLGYGARLASPLFARPRAWQVLDVLIGVTMLLIAVKLARG